MGGQEGGNRRKRCLALLGLNKEAANNEGGMEKRFIHGIGGVGWGSESL